MTLYAMTPDSAYATPPDMTAVSATEAAARQQTQRTYPLRGDITAGLALDLQAALRAGFRRITISSRGGEVLVARAMADMLNRSDATLVAEGPCLSACTYLWLATRRRTLASHATLALHATFDAHGPNDFGELWLQRLGRPDLARWARDKDLHVLTREEIGPDTTVASPGGACAHGHGLTVNPDRC